MNEEMKGTSIDVVNLNHERFQTVLLDIPWEYMKKMTNRIGGIDDVLMRSTLNASCQ